MQSPEIILLAGAPGSGKSSIGKLMISQNKPIGVRHLAIGDLKRDITSGKIPSAYAEMLQQSAHPDRKTGAAPSEAMTGIMEEFLLDKPETLTILDGFPRYMDRLLPFKESMARMGARVLALAVVEVDENVLLERLTLRAVRPGQKVQDPVERLTDHHDNIMPTIAALGLEYPAYVLDGALPLTENAKAMVDIYTHHTNQS